MKLKKYICPKCNYVNPVMELINTISCTSCRKSNVELVPNGYVVIDDKTWEVLEMSEEN